MKLLSCIFNELQQSGLDIMMCRGLACDNASTMAEIRCGVQCRMKQVYSKAIFILCLNHSLNLTGVHAVASSELSETFFGNSDVMY